MTILGGILATAFVLWILENFFSWGCDGHQTR